MMDDFQALITGVIAGSLAKDLGLIQIDLDIPRDGRGDYTNYITVISKVSGERLRVTVENETHWHQVNGGDVS